jgi:hypothetical protein
VKRENERLNRQIEILANKFKAKVSSEVLVREGWLDKRSEHLHQANVRCERCPLLFSADVIFVDFEKGCYGLEDVAASVGPGGGHVILFSGMLIILKVVSIVFGQAGMFAAPAVFAALNLLIFAQAYYESNLDAFPGSRKERKTVALKQITGNTRLLLLVGCSCFV